MNTRVQENAYPSWLDRMAYPFGTNTISINGLKMHYIDHGNGPVLLFVHGIPEWSFGYRNVIRLLAERYRCIVPDHVGFGLSEKNMNAGLSPADHADRLSNLIDLLGLKDIHLIVHDYGGPVGIGAYYTNPHRFKSITISNSWLWPLHNIKPVARGLKMMSGRIGKWLYLKHGFSVKFMVPASYYDKKKYSAVLKSHLLAPHSTEDDRYATYRLMLEMLLSSSWFEKLWTERNALKKKPLLFIWGMKDKFFSPSLFLQRWKDEFPGARYVEIDAGHFVHEEEPGLFAAALDNFVSGI